MTILQLAQQHIADLKRKTANEWAGPCPECGGTDRFLIWTHREAWHCRGCNVTGDAIEFLRRFESKSCPDAHIKLGLDCSKTNCPAWDKCRLGARANGGSNRPARKTKSLQPPAEKKERAFVPAEMITPEKKWQQQAAKLVKKAHAALLDCPEQIDYLSARGIPIDAIKNGKLGWLPADRYPSRENWGLDTFIKENGKKLKLRIPAGILIPFFDAERRPHRIRIRMFKKEGNSRYWWVKGSGDDVPVIGGVARRGVVVVESDLDAFMVRWQCRDLDVSVIPLGTCSAKPKGWAMQALQQALAILIAHDFEPRHNEKTGKPENPGGQGARWWLQQFPRATRWPVPNGKDPGEYYQDHNGDIRTWVLAGLPPSFHVQKPEASKSKPIPEHAKGQTISGHGYVIAYHLQHVEQLQQHYPNHVILNPEEMAALRGMAKKEAEIMLLAKKTFAGQIIKTKPIDESTYKLLPQTLYTPQLPAQPKSVQKEMIY